MSKILYNAIGWPLELCKARWRSVRCNRHAGHLAIGKPHDFGRLKKKLALKQDMLDSSGFPKD